ncbi:UDP-N-acetylmuramyl pentapeptide phosphotransferase [Aceticella autotrophica]|uniref:UDP-N-acetylmuramyl pentapeptide phosphotransferase n=1 Tax=Aceticella autotrophica TaxID=2755338 RepID=A0A974Y2P1_9THEO|nr:UDP-N-acetylmuramyl pentapeptide phosphotransferase [Aceticella autotrophica]QSZ26493.1 UDP-N-acetylmuramyl pentapeptide phosphotransferase [Aceticella autotrophica]
MILYLPFIISLFAMIITWKFVFQILDKSICLRENYKKDLVPACGGILFIPAIFLSFIVITTIGIKENNIYLFMISIIIMSYIGLIDDLLGDRSVTGLKGHIRSMLHGKLTTGGLKAVMGFLVALYLSINISKNIINIIINTLIIALFTNFLNLLDLRPGRAGKVFIFLSFVFLIIGNAHPIFLMIMLGIVIIYLPLDLKGKIMMGDAGSNVLGLTIGIASVIIFSFKIRIIILILLILIHTLTEKYSLTKIIEKNKLLNYIDMIGRK